MRAMKDSGIEWIGQIPREWSYSKIKYHCSMKSGDNITSLNIEETSHYPVYGGNGQRGYFPRYNVDGNKILIGRQGALAGNVHYVSGKFWATDHAIVTTPFKDINILYFYYLLKGYELNRYAQDTAAQPGLAVSKIMNLAIYLPSFIEQQQIADFLDTQCSAIDATAENLQKEISLLEDYKKSVITEAVTKGLNPDAEMKDSGMKWLPQIPKHWQVIPSKYLFANSDIRRQNGDEQLTASQKYGIITQKEYTAKENAQVVLATQGLEKWKHVEPYDFIISLRSFQGGLEMSEITGCITWHYVVLKAQKEIYHPYYKWLFKSARYINALQGTCNFIRDGQDLRFSNFSLVPLFEPPLSEQQQIADYLDAKCSEIDALIADKKKQLAILTEYKKSLIYEYVTGKKEVPAEKF